jgi:hypothetical protein
MAKAEIVRRAEAAPGLSEAELEQLRVRLLGD